MTDALSSDLHESPEACERGIVAKTELYQAGYEHGRRMALSSLQDQIRRMSVWLEHSWNCKFGVSIPEGGGAVYATCECGLSDALDRLSSLLSPREP